ncbi:DUF402 domain-containing protein [Radiobacillus sp. PE A8.2]|uniref:DUF402 domain-containing protein n=1 Tax=Radiobacillus sp. PE A8.2 TaxID=3380349 RepID=UPI00388FBEF5
MGNIINIKALKYPNIPHYEWKGEIIHQTADYVLVICKYGRKLKHHTKGKIFTVNNTSLEYFSLTDWHTVAMAIEEGKPVAYYCNIAMPSIWNETELTFVDLDLDFVKGSNEEWKVVDEDEFQTNSEKYNYPAHLIEKAPEALADLKGRVKAATFPFDGSLLEIYRKADTITYK